MLKDPTDSAGAEAGAEGADAAADSSAAPGDEVDNMIGSMMAKGSTSPTTMQALGDTGSKIALANENTVHKEGSDDDTQDEISKEAATKKQFESTEKADQEEKHKIAGEARQKLIDLNRQRMYSEEREKNFADNLNLMTEQSNKQNREQTRKQNEESTKKTDAVKREVNALARKRERDEEINNAKIAASEATAKDKSNFMIQQNNEEIRKLELQSKRRRDEETRKHDIKMKRRAQMFEAEQQKFKIDMEKKDEEQSKIMKRTMEDSEKANQNAKEQSSKYEHANARGRACGACIAQRVDFTKANNWNECPPGMLIHGMLRDPTPSNGADDLTRISQFECCRPCREDGNTPMPISALACPEVSWEQGTADTKCADGSCSCPKDTYLSALYRNDKATLNGLVRARCCSIEASAGMVSPCVVNSDLRVLTTARPDGATAGQPTMQRFTQDTFINGFTFKSTNPQTMSDWKATRDCQYLAYVV
jgi:hypothetical protein